MKPLHMRKSGLMLSFAVLLVAWVLVATTAYAQDPVAGQQAWTRNCGFCHGALAQGKVAVPNLAGAAGHIERLGIPPEALVGELTGLVREGIPTRMPAFPPEVLSDEDVANIGAYLVSTPAATGTNIFMSNCVMCHGVSGEGVIGPPLADTEQFFATMGWSLEKAAEELRVLVDEGIPGRMPSFPHLTDLEVQRLVVALTTFDDIQYWEKQFQQRNGAPPALWDRLEWTWALEFQARFGRPPTTQEKEANAMLTRGQGPAGPPPGANPPPR